MRRPRLALVSSFVLYSLAAVATAQEWSRFRGPNGSGEAADIGLPVPWTDRDYRWKIELSGAGYSSPVVRGDRLFVTSADAKDATLWIDCLRTSDGHAIWKREFASKPHPKHKFNGYASSTPALDDRHVYCLWANPDCLSAVALDQADGREVWRRDLGPFVAEHGFGISPVVFEDTVIVSNDQDGASFVVALECATGKTRWQTNRRTEKAGYATPCLWQPEGKTPQLILSSWAQGISSLDPRTGKPNWELPVFQNRTVGSPMMAAGLIFAAAGVGGVGRQMFAVRPGDPDRAIEPKVVYQVEGPLPYVAVPVANDRLVFLWQDRGVVTCLDAPTGKVLWRKRIGGEYFSSPIRIGDRLYCASREGEMVVLAAADTYKLVARFPLGERTHSTPAVAGGTLYLRTASHVMALEGRRASTP